MRWLARLATAAVLIAVFSFGVLFTLQNDTPVKLDLLIFQFQEQWLALWVLAAFVVGGALGVLVGMFASLGMKRKQLSATRQLKAANKELDKVKSAGVNA